MSTQKIDPQIDYPVYEPKKDQSTERSYSQYSDFNLKYYPIVPTQMLSKSFSVSASNSSRRDIENVTNRLLLNHPLSLSQRVPNMGHMSPNVSRQKSKKNEGVRIRKLIRVKSSKFENRNKGFPSESTRDEDIIPISNDIILNANFTQKYQPKVFADIAGHEINIRAISKAVEKMKVASLYLFHGPTGTGKTSTAKIFTMALNCKNNSSPKPCWSCRGCSRSLFIMDLCSGNSAENFEKIKTLLESTSFARAVPGFKVLIIKQSHLFNEKDWDELLGMAARAYAFGVAFVIITVSSNTVPLNILSRCQKFFFQRLTNREIMSKLAKIAANEGIQIEKEPLKMVATKAEGSLREAENLLDQLALLGSTITSLMVQRLVGLVPQNKLLDLLGTAISGDSIKTMRYTKELIATGVEPHPLVSQLAGLVTDILSDDPGSSSSSSTQSSKYNILLRRVHQLANSQSDKFCHALKVLVETEKQLRCSTDQNTILMAALLDITSNDFSIRLSPGTMWPKKESPGYISNVTSEDIRTESIALNRSNSNSNSISSNSEQLDTDTNKLFISINSFNNNQNSGITEDVKTILPNMNDMEEIWRKTLTEIQNGHVKDFLLQAKLASLTVSSGNIIVHLIFKRPEDKMAAQMSEITIRRVLQSTIGCDVTLNMSVVETGITEKTTVLNKIPSYKNSEQQQKITYMAEGFNSTSFEDLRHQSTPQNSSSSESPRDTNFRNGTQNIYATEKKVANTYPKTISPFFGLTMQRDEFDESLNSLRETLSREQSLNEPKYRSLLVSSIEQSDISVEPYSRDIFFDRGDGERRGNGTKNRKFRKGFLKYIENGDFPNRVMTQRWNYFGGCRDILCSRQTQ